MKIIITESQLRGIISKELMEDEGQGGGGLESQTIPFNFEFKQGYHSEKYEPNLLSSIVNTIKPVVEFLHKNPNATVKITVESGESAVTNYDNEKIKSGTPRNNAKLNTGELANLRAETIKRLLPESFKVYMSSGWKIGEDRFNKIIQQINVKSFGPTIKYDINKDNPLDVKYKKDQFIRFNIVTENVIPCLVDFTINVDYDQDAKSRDFHKCDQAYFEVSANDVILGNANMNNFDDGGFRYNQFKITQDLAKQILSNAPIDPTTKDKSIVLKMKCKPSPQLKYNDTNVAKKCHESVPHITITDSTKKVVSRYFPYKSDKYKELGHESEIVIGILDKCGKMIKQG